MNTTTQLYTVPELAKRFGVTERRVDYAARQIGIAPARRVGIIRQFDEHGAELIREAIERIAGNREVATANA